MQFVNDNNSQSWETTQQTFQHPLQTTPDVTMSMYNTSNSPSPSPLSPNLYDIAVSTPLPPSPVPNIMVSPSSNDNSNLRYSDLNTLGIGFNTA